MVSDYEEDRVDQEVTEVCSDAGKCRVLIRHAIESLLIVSFTASYCGIRDKKYPDKKPMGFPFDRLSRAGVDKLSSFLTPNMRVQEVKILFKDSA